jgi:Flp pilus assembly protein TadD
MLRHAKLALLPALLIGVAGCSGSGLAVDAAQRQEGSGDFQGALQTYESAIKDKPNLTPALRGRGRCQLKLGQPKEAEQSFRDAVNSDKLNVDAKLELASVLEARKGLMEAKIQYQDAYVIDPKNIAVIQGQAKCLEDENDFKGEVAKLQEAAALDPNNIDLHTNLAHTYGLMNQFDDAKKELAIIDKIKLMPKKQ